MNTQATCGSNEAKGFEIEYLGLHHDGARHRIKVNGKKALVSALVYELTALTNNDEAARLTGPFVGATPGYQPGVAGEQRFLAQNPETKKWYYIVGQIKFLPSKAVSASTEQANLANSSSGHPAETLRDSARPVDDEAAKKKHKRIEDAERAFRKELATVAAERAAGLNSLVSIAFAARFTRRSRATLYREFGKSLPSPQKLGRRSFLNYSDLERYMAAPDDFSEAPTTVS